VPRDTARYSAPDVLPHRMTADPALEWFLEDAKSQGLTHAEYERRYGVILVPDGDRPSPAAARIRRHEVLAGSMTPDDLGRAAHNEKRRAEARRKSRTTTK
jgi:hypothetical protein